IYGLLVSAAITIYPGYYLMVPFFVLFTFLLFENERWSLRIKRCAILCTGIVTTILIMQFISFIGGTNYIHGAAQLSKTILQGDFKEGFSFVLYYMMDVENTYGFVWIIGIILFVIISFKSVIANRFGSNYKYGILSIFIYYSLVVFFYYAYNSYVLHKMVFYGRILHMFIPAIVLATFAVVDICKENTKRIITVILLSVAIVNISVFYAKANNVVYPLKIIEKYRINTNSSEKLLAFKSYFPYKTIESDTNHSNAYTILNLAYFKTPDFDSKLSFDHRDTIVYALHFQNLKAFQYEGLLREVRDSLNDHPIYIGVFKLVH
ncbi:MAG: hypothetical protein WCG87_06465, partial [Bacteroidota bacterium]